MGGTDALNVSSTSSHTEAAAEEGIGGTAGADASCAAHTALSPALLPPPPACRHPCAMNLATQGSPRKTCGRTSSEKKEEKAYVLIPVALQRKFHALQWARRWLRRCVLPSLKASAAASASAGGRDGDGEEHNTHKTAIVYVNKGGEQVNGRGGVVVEQHATRWASLPTAALQSELSPGTFSSSSFPPLSLTSFGFGCVAGPTLLRTVPSVDAESTSLLPVQSDEKGERSPQANQTDAVVEEEEQEGNHDVASMPSVGKRPKRRRRIAYRPWRKGGSGVTSTVSSVSSAPSTVQLKQKCSQPKRTPTPPQPPTPTQKDALAVTLSSENNTDATHCPEQPPPAEKTEPTGGTEQPQQCGKEDECFRWFLPYVATVYFTTEALQPSDAALTVEASPHTPLPLRPAEVLDGEDHGVPAEQQDGASLTAVPPGVRVQLGNQLQPYPGNVFYTHPSEAQLLLSPH